tara:strand:- start:1892 stop:3733 length:1842 start_codon:yes stop_codon:yes gene_type:complete
MPVESNETIDEILNRFEESRDKGEILTAEQLTADHPELLQTIRRYIEALTWVPDTQTVDGDDSPRPLDTPPSKIGRYELEELLGVGGYGQVWKSHDPDLNRTVAIKLPRFKSTKADLKRSQFLAEAQRLAQLAMPGIVPVHDFGVDDGWCFFVGEYIEGKSLSDALGSEILTPQHAAELMTRVAQIVQKAHEQGVLHRDIKPSNILLKDNGDPVISDFGISTSMASTKSLARGTPVFMAPELEAVGSELDVRSDVYSLGVTLWCLVTGLVPTDSKSFRDASNISIPKWLQDVIQRATHHSPALRFQSARVFAERLESALAGHIASQRRGAVHRLVVTVVGLILGCVIGMLIPKFADITESPESSVSPGTHNPVLSYRFDHPEGPDLNQGDAAATCRIGLSGDTQITLPEDFDAPPPALGNGVRLNDGVGESSIRLDERWRLWGAEWSLSLWFRPQRSGNNDFIFYHGEQSGLGDARNPELNVYLDPGMRLRVLSYSSFRESSKQLDYSGDVVTKDRWHHLAITFRTNHGGLSVVEPGRLSVYLDGKQVLKENDAFLAATFRNSKAALIIGGVTRHSQAERNRHFKGVFACVQLFDRKLSENEVAKAWHQGNGR